MPPERGLGMPPTQRAAPDGGSLKHSPRGPPWSDGAKPTTPRTAMGSREHAARGAGTAPCRVGQARRRDSGQDPGVPKNASRLAPQHVSPRSVLMHVKRSPAASTVVDPRTEGPLTRDRAHATDAPF